MKTKELVKNNTHSDKVKGWIQQLLPAYGEHGRSILPLGQLLHDAKLDLSKERLWTKFLKSDALPFSPRKAQMLVRIWIQFNDLDPQTFAQFPLGWSIVYELTLIERPDLLRYVNEGLIHPNLTLAKAKELTAE